MARELSIFSKLIYCKRCGNNFRKIQERKKICYIDGGYSRKLSDCPRNKIEEQILLETIERYCFKNEMEYKADKSFIRDLVKLIEVDGDNIKIMYKNTDFSIIMQDKVII